jgi:tripartite-type tricarboxylate transporter receptor subunit TctC
VTAAAVPLTPYRIDAGMGVLQECPLMHRIFAATLAALIAGAAHAQGSWPQRPVTIVVPFGPGGSADLTARIIYTHLQANLGAAFVIDNRGGAGGASGRDTSQRPPPTAIRCSSVR